MTNKIIIEIINNDIVVETHIFKSLKELAKAYPQYEYHQLRQVYLKTNNKINSAKKLQKNSLILNVMKIYDESFYNAKQNELVH